MLSFSSAASPFKFSHFPLFLLYSAFLSLIFSCICQVNDYVDLAALFYENIMKQAITRFLAYPKQAPLLIDEKQRRNAPEKYSFFSESGSREFMQNYAFDLARYFRVKFVNIERKEIQQCFRKDVCLSSPQKASESPILFEHAKRSFGLNGSVQAKLLSHF